MIKFIAADLDGTLLNSRKELPDGFLELIRRLHKMGITFAAASGRQYYGVLKLFEEVKDKMSFIAENGGIAFENEKMIYSLPMSDEDAAKMLRETDKLYDKGVRVLLSGEKCAYVCDNDSDFMESCRLYCGRLMSIPNLYSIPDNDHIIKIAVFDPNAEKCSYPVLKKAFPEHNVILSADHWVDIVRRDVNKGEAVAQLMKRLRADYDEAMVFGDYLNDLEMMDKCKYSFAMSNGHEELKKQANFIAASNDENGVVKEILKLVPNAAAENN